MIKTGLELGHVMGLDGLNMSMFRRRLLLCCDDGFIMSVWRRDVLAGHVENEKREWLEGLRGGKRGI